MINIFLLLKICSATINNDFNKLAFYPCKIISIYNSISKKTINYLVKQHIKICILSENLNKLFYTHLTLTYVAIFVEITFSTYFIAITILDFEIDNIGVKLFSLYLIPWTIFHITKLIAISLVFQIVQTEIFLPI